ncbi:MAG TPA: ATPase domain-containing protein [Candidatus Polarisedimenticolia bacterium]|nr:ATPase domain-containing protein [Candidatus Polarisedimenticolia bacterium]
MTTDSMATGIHGLDHLLEGGILRGNSLLIEGPPGSGKSTLGVRILYEGAVRFGEPGLIISFEEFPKQLYQEAMNQGMDLQALEKANKLRVVWTPPARILEGFSGRDDLVDSIIGSMGVRRLLIDSITHFKRIRATEAELREVLAKILASLKIKNVNALLVKEQERMDEQTIAFEEYLVDASLRLHNVAPPSGGENTRLVEVRKTRGQGHISGRHPFELDRKGIAVYPRLRPQDIEKAFPNGGAPERKRVVVGIPGLDTMLKGGFWKGSLNLVVGVPGTGKSVIAYYFIDAGLRAGQPCLILSVKNTPAEILAHARSLGIDWNGPHKSGQLRILHFHPTGLCVEKMLDHLLAAFLQTRPDRVIFDSIDDLWNAVEDEERVRDYVLVLAGLFRASHATSLLLNERRQMEGARSGEVQDYSYLASCVIQLNVASVEGRVHRTVTVGKHAGSDHSNVQREFRIDRSGFQVDGGREAAAQPERSKPPDGAAPAGAAPAA